MFVTCPAPPSPRMNNCTTAKMFSGVLHLFFYSGLITRSFSSVEIVRGPLTVPNATIGGSASFECVFSNESVIPWWNINGYDIDVGHLPAVLQYKSNLKSKILTISPVWKEWNNSCIYCFLLFHGGTHLNSSTAKLIIQPPTPSLSTSWQISTTIGIATTTPKLASISTIFSSSVATSHIPTVTNLPEGYFSHQNLIVGVSAAVATALFISAIAIIAVLIYSQHKKGVKHNKECHVYEEVVGAVTANPVLHQNPAYENPQRITLEENPAYISIHKASLPHGTK